MQQWLPVDLKEKMRSGQPLQIIDVREPSEFSYGHIPGAQLIPLGQLPQRVDEIDKTMDTVVVCHSGGRSSVACDFLIRSGFGKINNLMGGMSMWDGDVEF